MARGEARIFVEIWKDESFLKLSASGQRMYFFLMSQPDLSHIGIIPYRPRRWFNTANGLEDQEVWDALTELTESKFVIIDEGEGELLIRSHLRNDRVYLQGNSMKAAAGQLPAIGSPTIRIALATEIDRIVAELTPVFRMSNGEHPLTDYQIACISYFLDRFRKLFPGIAGQIRDLTSENTSDISSNRIPTTRPSTKPSAMTSPRPLGERGEGLGSLVTDRRTKALPDADAPDALFDEPITDEVAPTRRGPMPRKAFQRLYNRWPRKGAPDAALKAFDQLLRKERVNQAQLEIACENYIRDMTGDRFARTMTKFLREGDWRDWILKTTAANPANRPRCPEHRGQLADNCPFHNQPEDPHAANGTP